MSNPNIPLRLFGEPMLFENSKLIIVCKTMVLILFLFLFLFNFGHRPLAENQHVKPCSFTSHAYMSVFVSDVETFECLLILKVYFL